jgi:hypothetical protein
VVVNPRQVPDSYIAGLDAIQHADGVLRKVEVALLDFLETKDADIRVSAEMAKLLDALHSVMGQLALVEMTTRKLFDEPARRYVPQASESDLAAGHRHGCRGEPGGSAGAAPGAGKRPALVTAGRPTASVKGG